MSDQKPWPRNKRAEPIDGTHPLVMSETQFIRGRKEAQSVAQGGPGSLLNHNPGKFPRVHIFSHDSWAFSIFGVFMSSKDNYSACLHQEKRNSTLGSVLQYFLPCSLLRDFLLCMSRKEDSSSRHQATLRSRSQCEALRTPTHFVW